MKAAQPSCDSCPLLCCFAACRALRRKIGGTARDYWKDWVEEEQVKNIKTYYKPGEAAAVPFLPFLVGVVVAMLAATAYVVAQTA